MTDEQPPVAFTVRLHRVFSWAGMRSCAVGVAVNAAIVWAVGGAGVLRSGLAAAVIVGLHGLILHRAMAKQRAAATGAMDDDDARALGIDDSVNVPCSCGTPKVRVFMCPNGPVYQALARAAAAREEREPDA